MQRELAALICLSAIAVPAAAQPPSQFDRRVEQLRQSFDVPGVSIAIVENGEIWARGYGSRDRAGREPVDARTIFQIGSTAKAMTAAALATLVDQGKIQWDDRVIDHLPDFRMYDPWVTREMTIRDLLSHRTGLGPGAGDLLFAPRSNLSRAETVRRLRYIKPATSFRSTYSYDNLAYIVLGQLIETVSGERWEGYIDRHVLAPAGMDEATTDLAGRLAVANRAHPNARISGSVRGVGPLVALDEANGLGDNANPAGGIAASAEDMAAWLNVQLSLGVGPGGKRIYSSAQASEMWKPLTIMPIGAPPPGMEALKANFLAYASGWSVRDYRGAKVFAHSGSVLGALAFVALIPDRNVGFSIAINSEDEALVRGLFYELLDHFLNLPAGSWPEKLRVQSDAQMKQAVEIVQASSKPPAKTSPTVELANYAGAYSDPWFGTVKIEEREGNLSLQLPHAPGLTAELQFWQRDTFLARFNDPSVEPIFVTFTFDPDGKVAGVRMKPASPLGGFDFEDLDLKPVTSKD